MSFSFTKTKSNIIPTMTTSTSTSQASQTVNSNISSGHGQLSPNKLTSSQLSKTTKLYPAWLKESSSCLKQLPGVYHGVLGQVQLQPTLVMSDSNKFTNGLEKLVKQHQKVDYFNRFTDTERVHQLLSTSRLSNENLATIWAHVNKTFPGRLTNREVCLALALIAIFQKLEKDGREIGPKNDPFSLVKLEKKPPVPTLFPNDTNHKSSLQLSRLPASNSVPNNLTSETLLIDITGGEHNEGNMYMSKSKGFKGSFDKIDGDKSTKAVCNIAMSLIDLDGDKFAVNLMRLNQVWLKYMNSMKNLFKRTFDVLNVENSRHSAMEALKSEKGVEFCKHLCLCYPLAHNIVFKVNELDNFKQRQQAGNSEQYRLFDKSYATQINDLMISINEYWAVLINLFHESGQTDFIELIMDGLNRDNQTIVGETLEELAVELDTANKADTCSICLTRFYLTNIGDALDKKDLSEADIALVLNNELLSENDCYYYHAKCANFWLNNVPDNDGGQLPFRFTTSDQILKPISS